ncbi:hypothetical protein PGT21_034313 [Puccinia graminis f. sp. tritici]|uniref:Uncharacterized protein n=1 Tax=Puccinia graminis f. sp. tritici TaxID=56615 RepID=A0A5B0PZW0_PUCGR|nr:hypothetical protein PGT21_034313 [Puccinia graminis f. sp. tritici]KAA1109448.1 hypothetical protein PGTUg99_033632 [Puccinia graminis f. sp. tritici]
MTAAPYFSNSARFKHPPIDHKPPNLEVVQTAGAVAAKDARKLRISDIDREIMINIYNKSPEISKKNADLSALQRLFSMTSDQVIWSTFRTLFLSIDSPQVSTTHRLAGLLN